MKQLGILADELIEKRYSMVLRELFDTVIRHQSKISKIDGDIIECGVWKGGYSIFLANAFPEKNIWVVDSYKGFQPLNTARYQYNRERHIPEYRLGEPNSQDDFTLNAVMQRFNEYSLTSSRIKYLDGFVKDTLPKANIEKIALLRVDVDAYSATKEVLDELYDKVQIGGYIIFDDSCLYECIDAMKDFFNERNIPHEVHHPITDELVNINNPFTNDNSGFPSGCYIIKK